MFTVRVVNSVESCCVGCEQNKAKVRQRRSQTVRRNRNVDPFLLSWYYAYVEQDVPRPGNVGCLVCHEERGTGTVGRPGDV